MERGRFGREYIGNTFHKDPTAKEAIGRAGLVDGPALARTARINQLTGELANINVKRKVGEIDKRTYTEMRAPLVQEYRSLLGQTMERR